MGKVHVESCFVGSNLGNLERETRGVLKVHLLWRFPGGKMSNTRLLFEILSFHNSKASLMTLCFLLCDLFRIRVVCLWPLSWPSQLKVSFNGNSMGVLD